MMAERAWKSLSLTTIKNCWNHTDIQCPCLPIITLRPPCPPMPANLAAGWDLIVKFVRNSWLLPEVHSALQECLGDQYIASEWNIPLDFVLGAEGNVNAALTSVNAWRNQWAPDAPDSPPELCEVATTPGEHEGVEEELLDLVTQLKARKRIFGEPLTIKEMLDRREVQGIGECTDLVDGGDINLEIVAMVWGRHDVEEVSSDSEDDEPDVVPPSIKDMIETCRKLEEDCLLVCTEGALDFVEAARQLRGHLQDKPK